jgi:hypothetical protein
LAHRGSHLGPFRPRPCEKLPFFSHQRKTAPASFDRIITGHKNPTLANCAAQTCAGSLSALRFPNIAFPAYVTLSAGVAATPSRKRDNGGKKRGSLGPQPLSANFLQLPHSPPFSPLALCVLRRRCVVGVSVATCCRPCLNQPAGVATSPPGPGSRRTNDAILFTADWINST